MKEVLCTNCQAACCQGGTIELTRKELSFMKRGGNEFKTIAEPEYRDRDAVFCPVGVIRVRDNPPTIRRVGTMQPLAKGLGRYIMEGPCKYLEDTKEGWQSCSVYDKRPGTCQRFEMDSQECRNLRELHGVDEASSAIEGLRSALQNIDIATLGQFSPNAWLALQPKDGQL